MPHQAARYIKRMNDLKLKEILSQSPSISSERRLILDEVINALNALAKTHKHLNLNFICTHNSRRSQLAQVWAHAIAQHLEIPVKAFSGGVEVTAFNPRAVSALMDQGFTIHPLKDNNPNKTESDNTVYRVFSAPEDAGISCFSKLYDDPTNPQKGFIAMMTCDHADENCPFIPGALARLSLRYEDPKAFDDTPLEALKYRERSLEIAGELHYIMSRLILN